MMIPESPGCRLVGNAGAENDLPLSDNAPGVLSIRMNYRLI